MYIPKVNQATDKNEIVSFMKQFSFATIITAKNNQPVATHLPFVVTVKDDDLILTSHFARANEQWADIENNSVLVIFAEPHAYISPRHYDKELNVPTWNYISVHAYGQGKLVTDSTAVFNVLESTISTYEDSFQQQWNNFPEEYKLKMVKGIVAFEITITDLQAKKKLSQNRSESEKRKIIDELTISKDRNEQLIGEFMMKETRKEN